MASLQHIKKRITGVQGVRKITSAMELVAATKMRKAQEVALASRPFAYTALEMLANIQEYLESDKRHETSDMGEKLHPLLQKRPDGKIAVLLVTSDKGLAGSFNSNVFRKFEEFARSDMRHATSNMVLITIGDKAETYAKRRGYTIAKSFTKYGDLVRPEEIESFAHFITEEFVRSGWSRLVTFSTNFLSTLLQEVVVRELLPLDFKKVRESVELLIPETGRYSELRKQTLSSRPARPLDYMVEPNPEEILTRLIPYLFSLQLYHLMLEANASEHSARRVAMKNASDNAAELAGELTQEYNRSRQAAITKELTEIVGTAKALNG